MDITYMRITKYDICLVWILPQYKFAVLRYYIISFPIHFTFQYTYISQFFFWRLWCRYMRFCGVNTGADAGCGVGTAVVVLAPVTAVAVSVLEMAVVPVLVPAMA